jgi:serine protein kinase
MTAEAHAADWTRRMQGQTDRPTKGESISFQEYLAKVIAEPRIAALSHQRIYDMIMSHGIDDKGRYNFFKDHLFGLDEQIEQVVSYFRAGAQRLDTRKRILLLRGPVSSAKSTLVDLMKAGLEDYTRTPPGAVYAIDGCPMNEEPLHLVPRRLREELKKEHDVYVEGTLCPVCEWRLKNDFGGDVDRFKVRRVFFSEQGRLGIGTFLPSDPKSQDMSELVGSINFARIGEVGVESHPEAYTFDGELNISNRGLMEFIEMLKADEKFLYVLLTLTQEQVIKAPRFPRIYADLCLIAHTNESEYNEFVNDPRSEALQDRIIVVDFPYNLSTDHEERIYHKLLSGTGTKKHIAPHALKVASMVAVLSRLEEVEDPKLDLVTKMRLYNGERLGRWGPSDVAKLKESAKREGMDGISPRYITNRIATALIQDESGCITPDRVLEMLASGLRTHPRFSDKDRERYRELISLAYERYAQIAEDAVRNALVVGLEDQCEDLFKTYLDNVAAYVQGDKGADERLLRMIEKRVGIQEPGKDSYRRQILARAQAARERGERFDHNADDPIRRSIHDLVYEENKNQVRTLVGARDPDPALKERILRTRARLVSQEGNCEECAQALLQFVGAHDKRVMEQESKEASQ